MFGGDGVVCTIAQQYGRISHIVLRTALHPEDGGGCFIPESIYCALQNPVGIVDLEGIVAHVNVDNGPAVDTHGAAYALLIYPVQVGHHGPAAAGAAFGRTDTA